MISLKTLYPGDAHCVTPLGQANSMHSSPIATCKPQTIETIFPSSFRRIYKNNLFLKIYAQGDMKCVTELCVYLNLYTQSILLTVSEL
jgi:hypothetical protein